MKRVKFKEYSSPTRSFYKKSYLQLWQIIQFIIFNIPLPSLNIIRVITLKLFGAEVGNNVIIRPFVNIYDPSKLVLGDGVWIGERAWLYNFNYITCEANSVISQEAVLCTASHNFKSPKFETISDQIVVGKESWICLRAVILPGSFTKPQEIIPANSVRNKKNNELSVYNS